MRQIGGDIDIASSRLQGIEVFGERLPVPRQPVDHHDAGDVLDTGHHVHEHVVIGGPAGGEADAAVAHHRRRHTVGGRRCHAVRPDRLAVVVGMQIDEARRDEQTGCIDLPDGVVVNRADRRDDTVGDGDVAGVRVAAEAVNDGAVADDEFECHPSNLR